MRTETDFLVIGSGIAGLTFAIHAAAFGRVLIITKKKDSESNTNYAQGGIACVLDPFDSFEKHQHDTLSAGNGLCDPDTVKILVEEGPARIVELLEWGSRFSKSRTARNAFKLHLGREGGHSMGRIVHSRDLTGREIERTLLEKIKKIPGITMYENHYAVELITNHHLRKKLPVNRCLGAYVLNTVKRRIYAVRSKVTCIATGGPGRVYLHTTNPEIATGDGIALAYRAGADIANMEFIQFHPTTLFHEGARSFLISEALRGYGAVLRDGSGKEFMKKYHRMGALAPRDIVARAIDKEMKKSGQPCVFLDIRHAPAGQTKRHFPHIYHTCKSFGITITRDLIPVVPAAHYCCGGLRVDTNGNSTLPGLYACGEASCTGVHGANRLASNSLLEALVFSRRAALAAGESLPGVKPAPRGLVPPWDDSGTLDTEEWVLLSHNVTEIRTIMWDYVGIVRSNLRLQRAIRRVSFLEKEIENYYKRTRITPGLLELRNMAMAAKLIVLCAVKRRESRGLHFTTDYPARNDRRWEKNTILRNRVRT
jgi:L-aspartate oxidase